MHDEVRLHAEDMKSVFPSLGNRYVGGEGGDTPRVMIVGDAPSARAEVTGFPFAGHDGVVLRQLAALAGLEHADCWFTNLLKYRPAGGRHPRYEEVLAFRNVLKTEWISVGRPALVVALGPAAYMGLAGRPAGDYGKYATLTKNAKVTLLHHPALGLRQASLRKEIENEWRKLHVPSGTGKT